MPPTHKTHNQITKLKLEKYALCKLCKYVIQLNSFFYHFIMIIKYFISKYGKLNKFHLKKIKNFNPILVWIKKWWKKMRNLFQFCPIKTQLFKKLIKKNFLK